MKKISKENHEYNLSLVDAHPINKVVNAIIDDELKLCIVKGYYLEENGRLKIKVLDIYTNETLFIEPDN